MQNKTKRRKTAQNGVKKLKLFYNKIIKVILINIAKIHISKNPQCRVCANGGPKTLSDYEQASCWEL